MMCGIGRIKKTEESASNPQLGDWLVCAVCKCGIRYESVCQGFKYDTWS